MINITLRDRKINQWIRDYTIVINAALRILKVKCMDKNIL